MVAQSFGPAPLPGPPRDTHTLADLREAQTLLDQIPGCEAKGLLRLKLDSLQRYHGGLDEWGRRADGTRPSEQRKGRLP